MGNKNKGGDKKRKHESTDTAAAAASTSLFGASKDAELGGLFGAAASFALPAPAVVASSSRLANHVPAQAPEKPSKKAKKEQKGAAKKDGKKDGKGKAKAKEAAVAEDKPEESMEVEEANVTIVGGTEDNGDDSNSDSDSGDVSTFVHESLKTPAERRKREAAGAGAQKWTPADETKEQRDKRTLFVGNLALEAAKSKSILHQLKSHLVSFAPTAKIESVRFRSVSFATPTAALPGHEDESPAAATRRVEREKERVAQWKATQASGSTTGGAGNRRGDDEVVDKSKSFLDSKGKRRVAFIKHEFHSDAATCNAYVVFAYAHPDRPTNVAPIMDPIEAADAIAAAANGTEFMDRIIRVDHVRLPSAQGLQTAATALGKRDAWLPANTDPKCSLFVGGLDYAAKEEDVRAFFEALVVAERGPAEGGARWVTSVRIVRDKDTQLGKGFGYIHTIDRESCDELIALSSQKLKFAKKPLRLQAARTLPGKKPVIATPSAGTSSDRKDSSAPRRAAPTGPLPRGNPALGDKIKDLSKDERKVAKSADAERQARRMAKKAAKVARDHTEKGAVKLAATKADKNRTAKKVTAKKGRVRSAHALTKMKGKRT